MKLSEARQGASPTTNMGRKGSHRPEAGSPCVRTRIHGTRSLAAGLLALAIFLAGCDEGHEPALSPESSSEVCAAGEALPAPDAGPELGAEPVVTDPAEITKAALRKLNDPQRFAGRGSLRGYLTMPPGIPAPQRWVLTIEPSRTLAGREHAVERRLELPGSATEFEFDDLPLGGYDLRVRTEGYVSLAQAVSLERGSENPYVQVALAPLGTVRGVLVDEEGRQLAARDIHMQLRRSGEVVSTRTTADGSWFFEGVEPGAWSLYVDSVDAPAVAPIDFDNSGARSSNLGEQRVPVTGTIELQVTDEFQVGLPGIRVVGYSMQGGSFERFTDDEGKLTVNALQLGEWKLMAVDENEQRARTTVKLTDAEPYSFYMSLPR
ncbi:MAG: carboxypeptidase regulatory-like domain-containing protein [Planctomycetes bacterium]|nr:carboxypeptidase regulatory-like domain-containing protein [Planctomycetota bacterium]MCB9905872.1 carboxypeptidase regulatory-like domain-containing protein [Planctomycetota bacterium]